MIRAPLLWSWRLDQTLFGICRVEAGKSPAQRASPSLPKVEKGKGDQTDRIRDKPHGKSHKIHQNGGILPKKQR